MSPARLPAGTQHLRRPGLRWIAVVSGRLGLAPVDPQVCRSGRACGAHQKRCRDDVRCLALITIPAIIRCIRLARRPTNWLLRIGRDHLWINTRPYDDLSSSDDPSVIELEYHEIADVRCDEQGFLYPRAQATGRDEGGRVAGRPAARNSPRGAGRDHRVEPPARAAQAVVFRDHMANGGAAAPGVACFASRDSPGVATLADFRRLAKAAASDAGTRAVDCDW